MNIADEIKRLHELHQAGALSDAEFAQAKARLLATGDTSASGPHQNLGFNQLNQFRRSKTDQWLGGLCGGLGKFTGMESWIWRLMFVFFSLYFGAGVVAYLLAWIFVPEEE
ncbi:PspC domain-containing protein [Undibacterium sp. Ji49W]|uniref:PspC domain-containing protein n=1 Tax=Undibacterium sp. Ji49W TaxID=3413040 RepID=UPI003BEFA0B2